MVFPLARDSEIASLDLDHATYVVYKTEADSMCWGGRLLSLKVVFRGQVRFQLYNHMQYTLGTGEYLILNADKEYDIYKESRQPIETLGVYFEESFASDVLRTLQENTVRLLDDPIPPDPQPVNFFERIFPNIEILTPTLYSLRKNLPSRRYSLPWLEERFYDLLDSMFKNHLEVRTRLNDLSSIRVSLRKEIYQRLYRAHDYAMASLDRKVTIQEMASIALMSPSHFLRTFKLLFGISPNKFFREKRMERARQLLTHSSITVTEICNSIGYRSLSNFSWEFQKRFGFSPLSYRLKYSNF